MHVIVPLGGNALLEENLAVVLLQKQSSFLALKWAFQSVILKAEFCA